jgi:hypothetical protein
MHRFDDAFDLLDVRPFVASQPPCIELRGSLEDLSRSCHCRRAGPGIARQRGEDGQELGTLGGKGTQRGPEFQFEIVRLLHPRVGIDRPQRRSIPGDHRHDAVTPDVMVTFFSRMANLV